VLASHVLHHKSQVVGFAGQILYTFDEWLIILYSIIFGLRFVDGDEYYNDYYFTFTLSPHFVWQHISISY